MLLLGAISSIDRVFWVMLLVCVDRDRWIIIKRKVIPILQIILDICQHFKTHREEIATAKNKQHDLDNFQKNSCV